MIFHLVAKYNAENPSLLPIEKNGIEFEKMEGFPIRRNSKGEPSEDTIPTVNTTKIV